MLRRITVAIPVVALPLPVPVKSRAVPGFASWANPTDSHVPVHSPIVRVRANLPEGVPLA
jgi:hypothetical protein